MKILFLIQHFSTGKVAGGSKPWSLAKSMADKGYDVTVVTSNVHYIEKEDEKRSKYTYEEYEGVKIIKVNATGNFRKNFFTRIMNYVSFAFNAYKACMKINDIDVVLTSIQPIFTGPVGLHVSKKKKARFILEVRDIWPDTAIEIGALKSPILIKMSSWLALKLYKGAEKIITLTPGIADLIIEKGINKNKVYCIPIGFNLEEFEDEKIDKTLRKKYNWEDKFIAMYTGSHATTDSLDVMVKTAEYLKDNKNIKIVSIGDGDKRGELIKYCEERSLDNIEFIGIVPRTEIPSYLHAADITFICLKKGEHWKIFLQNKFFDYMGAKKPIVTVLKGTQQEMVEDANAGLAVEPEDYEAFAKTLIHLSNNKEECIELGQNGYEFVNKYFNRDDLLDFYLKLIENNELLHHDSIIYKYSQYKRINN